MRQAVLMDDEVDPDESYEVYARLTNHCDFVFAYDCTKSQAERAITDVIRELNDSGLVFKQTVDGAYVCVTQISKLYLDGEGSTHSAMIQDTSGASYHLFVGEQAECARRLNEFADKVSYIAANLKRYN